MIQKMFLRRALTLLLVAALAFAPSLSLAENVSLLEQSEEEAFTEEPEALPAEEPAAEDPNAIKYVATATVALKLRKAPEDGANGIGSIAKDKTVYIVTLGPEWCKVRERNDGYVRTKYLTDVRAYDEATETVGEATEVPSFESAAAADDNGFTSKFYAFAVRDTMLFKEPSETANVRTKIKIYDKVYVSENSGGWSYCKYGNYYGYVITDALFKWDRVDPFAGDIPGQILYQAVAFVKRPANVYSMETNKVLNEYPINAGSAICVMNVDGQGRYETMFHRELAYINADDVASTLPVVAWADAQPGDLISVMTTFYGVGISSVNFQGRNWNIYMAGSKITGTVLEPGDYYNMNKTIGPYSKSTGYKRAPIMSPTKLWGYGGGTCQVNTTFYITTVAVPLLVTHRKVHANVGMYYCLKGFDAAVGGGDTNLEMTNTLPYAVRYQFMISDGVMTCCIFRDH